MKHERKPHQRIEHPIIETRVTLEVPAEALRGQVNERIEWHKRNVALIESELAMPSLPAGASKTAEGIQEHYRRTDLKRELAHHEERIRFLRFIGAHIPRDACTGSKGESCSRWRSFPSRRATDGARAFVATISPWTSVRSRIR
jgi:hypothetical protein